MKRVFQHVLHLILGLSAVCFTAFAGASPLDPGHPPSDNFGYWWDKFRICVSAQVEQGISAAEARQVCASVALNAPQAARAELLSPSHPPSDNFGMWWYEFRICVSAQVEQGVSAAEARQVCASVALDAPQAARAELLSPSHPPSDNFGMWWDEFRTCVSAQVEQGVSAAEARQVCAADAAVGN